MANNETAARIVRQEVYLCLSMLVADYQESHPDDWADDCVNLTREVCPHCGTDHDPLAEFNDDDESLCSYCDTYYEPEVRDAEVYEWWAVSDWLADKLLSRGEVIFTMPGDVKVWGRQTTGQAIDIDGVIVRIAEVIS